MFFVFMYKFNGVLKAQDNYSCWTRWLSAHFFFSPNKVSAQTHLTVKVPTQTQLWLYD